MDLWHKYTRPPVGRADGQRFTIAPIDLIENAQPTEVPRLVCSSIVGKQNIGKLRPRAELTSLTRQPRGLALALVMQEGGCCPKRLLVASSNPAPPPPG